MNLKCYLVRVTAPDGRTLTSTRLAPSQTSAERLARDDAWEDFRLPRTAKPDLSTTTLKEVAGPYLDDSPPDWDEDPTLCVKELSPVPVTC